MCFKNCACIVSLFVSIILGVVASIALFFGVLPIITGLPLLVFLTGIAILVSFSFLLGVTKHSRCACRYGYCILFGSALSIVLAAIARILAVVAANIGFAILIGFLVAAFLFAIFSFYAFLACFVKENCYPYDTCSRD